MFKCEVKAKSNPSSTICLKSLLTCVRVSVYGVMCVIACINVSVYTRVCIYACMYIHPHSCIPAE